MSLVNELTDLVADAFEAIGIDRSHGDVVVSQRPDLADFQCNGALPAAKAAGRNPREIAQDVVDRISGDGRLAEVSIAGPGFINLTVTDDALATAVRAVAADESFLAGVPSRKVLVDYGGPNVAKELHVGHLRPAIIGESIKRALRFIGHEVVGDVHLGDWGLPMGQLIAQLRTEMPDLVYFDETFEGPYPDDSPVTVAELNRLYPTASGRAKADPDFAAEARQATFELQDGRPGYRALWEHFRRVSVDAMREVYDELGVHFERWYGEATVHDRIGPMIERLQAEQVAHESDGAVVIDVARPDDTKEVPPVVIVSSTGAYLYSTTDLATLEDRAADGFDDVMYFVDVRQGDHFEGVFRAARDGGLVPADVVTLDHVGTGLVNGQDGKPLKTRDGDLPLLRSLVQDAMDLAKTRMDERGLATDYPEAERAEVARTVGLAALKYGDLQNHRTSNYTFDLERFTSFEGKTGPYLLYGAVRMASILREAAQRSISVGEVVTPAGDADRNLMLRLLRFGEIVHRSIDHRSPNHIAEHAYEIVAEFNRFYEACRILDEPDERQRAGWLGLVALTRSQLVALLDILAIEVPDRM